MQKSSSLSDFRFSADYINTFVQVWRAEGLDVRPVLEQAGLTHRLPLPDDGFLTGAEFMRLYQAGSSHPSLPPDFSLKLSRSFNFTHVGLLGLAIITSENLHTVLDILQRYFHLYCPGMSLRYGINDALVCIEYSPSEVYNTASPFLMEVIAGVIKRFTAYFRNSPQPTLVEFAHARRQGVGSFQSYFGCEVLFGAGRNSISFNIADLATPAAMSEPTTQAQLLRQLEDIRLKQNEPLSWTERTRQVWLALLLEAQSPTLESVAAEFNMTPRTLERKLKQEGLSYTRIAQELRVARAKELLCTSKLSIGNIAERVGFQDSASFSRFFKREVGETPVSFRARIAHY